MVRTAAAFTSAALAVLLACGMQSARAQCCGDCDLDNNVTIDELITSVNRSLKGCSDDGICAAAALRGLTRVDYSSKADSNSPKVAFAKCPSGRKVVGGGAKVFIAGERTGPVALKASFPSDTLDGWAVTAEETAATNATWFVTAFALCAVVAD